MENMEWRKKLEILKAEIDALEEKAEDLVGININKIKECANQSPIEKCMVELKIKDLVVHSVLTAGVHCLILSSKLYPEVGLLIFDGPEFGSGGWVSFIGGKSYYLHEYKFSMVCACCTPYLNGVSSKKRQSREQEKNLNKDFVLAVRTACKEQQVKYLFLGCHANNWEQDVDGLHLFP